MKEKKVVRKIGSHGSTIIALYMNYLTETKMEIVSLDEDGVIKIHKENTVAEVNLSEYFSYTT